MTRPAREPDLQSETRDRKRDRPHLRATPWASGLGRGGSGCETSRLRQGRLCTPGRSRGVAASAGTRLRPRGTPKSRGRSPQRPQETGGQEGNKPRVPGPAERVAALGGMTRANARFRGRAVAQRSAPAGLSPHLPCAARAAARPPAPAQLCSKPPRETLHDVTRPDRREERARVMENAGASPVGTPADHAAGRAVGPAPSKSRRPGRSGRLGTSVRRTHLQGRGEPGRATLCLPEPEQPWEGSRHVLTRPEPRAADD